MDTGFARIQPAASPPAPRAPAAALLPALRRHRLSILAAGLAAGFFSWLAARSLPPSFVASAVLVLDTQRVNLPEIQGVVSEGVIDLPLVRTEVQVLRSRAHIQEIAESLGLDARPEFNPNLREPSGAQALLRRLIGLLPAPLVATVVEDLGIALPRARPVPLSAEEVRQAVANIVGENLSVATDNRSYVIGLSFRSGEREVAAAVANGLVERYLAERSDSLAGTNREASLALRARIAEIRDEMDRLERRQREVRAANNLIETQRGTVTQQQLSDLAAQLTLVRVTRAEAEGRVLRLRAVLAGRGSLDELGDVVASRTVQQLRDQEALVVRRQSELAARFGPAHPDIVQVRQELDGLRRLIAGEVRRIAATLESAAELAREREAELARQLEAAGAVAARMSDAEAELRQIDADLDARRSVFQALMLRGEQTGLGEERASPRRVGARLVSAAEIPAFPASPRPTLAGLLGGLAGAAAAAALAILRGLSDRGAFAAAELAAAAGLPVLATLPRLPRHRGAGAIEAMLAAPEGPGALRLLRAQLLAAALPGAARSVAFLPVRRGEGASTAAAAFATQAARDGVPTLLVCADLAAAPGATEGAADLLTVLRGEAAATPGDGLTVLAAGAPVADPYPLLEGPAFRALLAEAAGRHALVVIDGPPCTDRAEAAILSRLAEASVLVAGAGSARLAEIAAASAALQPSARWLAGAVLTRAAPQRSAAR